MLIRCALRLLLFRRAVLIVRFPELFFCCLICVPYFYSVMRISPNVYSLSANLNFTMSDGTTDSSVEIHVGSLLSASVALPFSTVPSCVRLKLTLTTQQMTTRIRPPIHSFLNSGDASTFFGGNIFTVPTPLRFVVKLIWFSCTQNCVGSTAQLSALNGFAESDSAKSKRRPFPDDVLLLIRQFVCFSFRLILFTIRN